ncbi:MAG: T9SS type A sorting domain-containing protein [Bacteroidota bacterium]|nr:T9SS type A sorting domain-containing protein [Bacteroidota bacterium]MDP4232566.1 T9SS type A sorting domain-containing protein [Bacteroidota bacterium]MDP4242980.1 T9SS type A sorting domain-containing protein [Bacteroidota bacterium]MDP4286445.1 T9SS type A sorting domain-containing protein [Bacteroidota bacterium]
MKAIARWSAFLALLISVAGLSLPAQAQQWSGTNGPWGGAIRCMASSSTTLYAGTIGHGIFASTNNGASWSPVPNNVDTTVLSIATSGNIILAGTSGGNVLLSMNSGASFALLTNLNATSDVVAVAVHGTVLFAGTGSDGVIVSSDNGANWSLKNSGLRAQRVSALTVAGNNVYAAIPYYNDSSLRVSTNDGASWTFIATPGMNPGVNAIAASAPLLLTATDGGVYLSMNGGATWTQRNTGMTDTAIRSIAASSTTIFAGSVDYYGTGGGTGGIFAYSISQGLTGQWNAASTGLSGTGAMNVFSLATSGTNAIAGTDDGIYASANSGSNWTSSNTGLSAMTITALRSDGHTLYAGTDDFETFWSVDAGAHWSHLTNGLFRTPIRDISVNGSTVFYATDSGFYRTTNNGINWTRQAIGMSDSIGPAIFTTGSTVYAGTYTRGVYSSTNNGNSWLQMNLGLTSTNIAALTANNTNVFAGCATGGVFTSVAGATLTWTQLTSGLQTVANLPVVSLADSGSAVYAATLGGGVFVTTNNLTWSQIAPGTTGMLRAVALAVNKDTVFIASQDQGVYYATRGATGWNATAFGLSSDTLLASIAVQGSFVFAGTRDHGVQQSPMPAAIAPPNGVGDAGTSTLALAGIYPNPVSSNTDISFSLDAPRVVTLSITDVSGHEVKLITNQVLTPGPHAYNWDASHFAAGVYLCRLSADGQSLARNIVVTK